MQGATDRPVQLLESLDAVIVVGEETTFIAVDDGNIEYHIAGRRAVGIVGCLDKLLQLTVFSDDGAYEGVVVLVQGVGLR